MPLPTVALVSLGCPKNQVDAEVMLGLLQAAGYRIVEDTEAAEAVIVNTCAFIRPAQEEAIEALLDLADLKQTGSLRALLCAGCLTQRHGRELLEELPEVDVFLGPGSVPRIAEALQRALAGERAVISDPLEYLCDADTPRWRGGPAWLAHLKIAEGCDNRCAYCTVPSLRGRYRSRALPDLLAETRALIAEGVREILVIAQDTTAWGRDLNPPAALAELIRALGGLDYDGWLRLMYLHPAQLSEDLLAAMAEAAAVLPYLDLPLQHASEAVLRGMGRAGGAEDYLALLERIRRYLPAAAIRSTFIVGYPGETEADLQTLLQFVQEARLDRVALFPYWPEEGTPAADLPDRVPAALAHERLERLRAVAEAVSLENHRRLVGSRLPVLVEQVTPQGAVGRSYRDAPEVDGEVYLTLPPEAPPPAPGQFVEAEVTGAQVHDLEARVCEGVA